jgi:hypothetical protein
LNEEVEPEDERECGEGEGGDEDGEDDGSSNRHSTGGDVLGHPAQLTIDHVLVFAHSVEDST